MTNGRWEFHRVLCHEETLISHAGKTHSLCFIPSGTLVSHGSALFFRTREVQASPIAERRRCLPKIQISSDSYPIFHVFVERVGLARVLLLLVLVGTNIQLETRTVVLGGMIRACARAHAENWRASSIGILYLTHINRTH